MPYSNLRDLGDEPPGGGTGLRVMEGICEGHVLHHRGARPIHRAVTGTQGTNLFFFWSGGVEDSDSGWEASLQAALGPSIVGIAFGAMHCIAWSYEFPSHTELVLWHVSCVAMMAVPLLSTVACAVVATEDPPAPIMAAYMASLILLPLSAWLYIASRIATIVIAFTTLRSLPSEAFAVVDWTTFIPHI
jgi:hypothetical protein